MLDCSPKSNKKATRDYTPAVDDDLGLEANFIRREASIKCIDKMKRMKRRTLNQGTMTQLKDTDKLLVAIDEKDYQKYREDQKLKSKFSSFDIFREKPIKKQ